MEKKREGDKEAAGEVFLASDPLYHWFFGIGDGKGENGFSGMLTRLRHRLTPGSNMCICALFAWLISHQPAVFFSHNKPATSNQPAVLFSQNKPAPAISHQPTEQVDGLWLYTVSGRGAIKRSNGCHTYI
jgi:hypothetical protein